MIMIMVIIIVIMVIMMIIGDDNDDYGDGDDHKLGYVIYLEGLHPWVSVRRLKQNTFCRAKGERTDCVPEAPIGRSDQPARQRPGGSTP